MAPLASGKTGDKGRDEHEEKQVSHAIIISVMLSFVIAVFHTIHASELTPLAQIAEGWNAKMCQ